MHPSEDTFRQAAMMARVAEYLRDEKYPVDMDLWSGLIRHTWAKVAREVHPFECAYTIQRRPQYDEVFQFGTGASAIIVFRDGRQLRTGADIEPGFRSELIANQDYSDNRWETHVSLIDHRDSCDSIMITTIVFV